MAATSGATINLSPTAVDADGVCASQSPAAGAILINGAFASGGVATINSTGAHLVRLTSGGNDSGITFTFNGTDADGNTISETVAGTNVSNTDTTKYFKTITSITASAAVAGTIIVGNLITCVSASFKPDTSSASYFAVGIGVILVSGTSTFGIEQTYEDLVVPPIAARWFAHGTITAKSASSDGNTLIPCTAMRIKATASSSGVLKARFIQVGV